MGSSFSGHSAHTCVLYVAALESSRLHMVWVGPTVGGARASVSNLFLAVNLMAASWPAGQTLEVLDTHRWMGKGGISTLHLTPNADFFASSTPCFPI